MSGEESDRLDDSINTLPILSEEDELETTVNQSSDSFFRGSSASSLFIPSARKREGPLSSTPQKRVRTLGRPPSPCTSASSRGTLKCTMCRATLKTERGLEKHVRNHKLAEKAQRKPSPSQLVERCIQDGCNITKNIDEAPFSEDLGGDAFLTFARTIRQCALPDPSPGFQQFVTVCVQPLSEHLPLSDSVLPSSIHKEVRHALHTSLGDPPTHLARMKELLSICGDCETAVAAQYLGEFCRRLVNCVMAFVLKCMCEAGDDSHVQATQKFSTDDYNALFSQQTLHNVAGYSVKAVLVRSRQYNRSPRWQAIQNVVLERFAHIGTMVACRGERSFWTALLGRKAYTFVSEPALDFFVEVAKVMCYTETFNGNLSKGAVLGNVCSSPLIISKWGSLIGSRLSESDSTFLMRLLVGSLCGSFGRGILLRRMNQEAGQHRGRVSAVGLRGRLTR